MLFDRFRVRSDYTKYLLLESARTAGWSASARYWSLHRLGQLNTGLRLYGAIWGLPETVQSICYIISFLISGSSNYCSRSAGTVRFYEQGIDTMLMYGRITYATVNRLCYYTYRANLYGIDYRRACLQEDSIW